MNLEPPNLNAPLYKRDYPRSIDVKIESMGPVVEKDELPKIDTKGFRSIEAKKTGEKGSGFGLYFAKFVGDLHDASLHFASSKEAVSFNGARYSTFSVTLSFPV